MILKNVIKYKDYCINELGSIIEPRDIKISKTKLSEQDNLVQYKFKSIKDKNNTEYRLDILETFITYGKLKDNRASWISFSKADIPFGSAEDPNLETEYNLLTNNQDYTIISNIFWLLKDYISKSDSKILLMHSENDKLNNWYIYFLEKNNYKYETDIEVSLISSSEFLNTDIVKTNAVYLS